MSDLFISESSLLLKAVAEQREKEKANMGRAYASGYEVWAKVKRMMEEAKVDEKTAGSLHDDVWKAVKEDNEDALIVNLHALGNDAIKAAMTWVYVAAEAHRAADELRGIE